MVVRSRWHARLLWCTWFSALWPLLYFSTFQVSTPLRIALAGVWLLGGWIALRAWRASATGLLQWDGEQWHWVQDGDSHACEVRLVWDWQQVILVRAAVAGIAVHWWWLEADGRTAAWDALRRALVYPSASFTEPSSPAGLEGQR